MEPTNPSLSQDFKQLADQVLPHSVTLAVEFDTKCIEDGHRVFAAKLASQKMGDSKSSERTAARETNLNELGGMCCSLCKAFLEKATS